MRDSGLKKNRKCAKMLDAVNNVATFKCGLCLIKPIYRPHIAYDTA